MVLRQSETPVGIGRAVGLAGALAMGGAIASLLYDVRRRDPLVLAVVLGVVATVGGRIGPPAYRLPIGRYPG